MNEKNQDEKIEWTALEYEERERNPDWFWALGIIIVTGALASIIFHNYFFALLLLLSGGLLGYFAIKKPDLVSYELNNRGLRIRDRLYLYENIKSFWVRDDAHPEANSPIELHPMLFVRTERIFMPMLTAPISKEMAPIIHQILYEKGIPEEEMREHTSEKIMDFLGF